MLRKKLKLDPVSDNECPPDKKQKTLGTVSPNIAPGTERNSSINEKLLYLAKKLNNELKPLTFKSPVVYCYNPGEYALEAYSMYVNKYCTSEKDILFVGMNPGPFGMCQTGVPFGEVSLVRDWLEINANISQPQQLCPQRPILGFQCTKSEISGKNFWGLFKSICGNPSLFFRSAFVYNYCPLAFMRSNGANITPNTLKGEVKSKLEDLCSQILQDIIKTIRPKYIIGIGKYAYEKCNAATKDTNAKVIYMIHPSPIIPKNQDWPEKARNLLCAEDLMKYFEK